MIIKKELRKLNLDSSGQKAYFDPTFNPNLNSVIRILPLLVDETLVYLNKDNPNHIDIIDNSEDLVDAGFFRPVAISESKLPEKFISRRSILRNKIFDESLFSRDYKESIKQDYGDEYLKDLVKQVPSKNDICPKFDKIAYALNWDVIFSQVIRVPLVVDYGFRGVLSYKCDKLLEGYCPERLKRISEVKDFISKINPLFPANLGIDKIHEFRKEKTAIQFRNWIEGSIHKAYSKEVYGKIHIDNQLIKDFNELSASYSKRNRLVSQTIGCALGGVLGFLSGGPVNAGVGSAIGAMAVPPFSRFLELVWKRTGPNPWVFLLNR